MRSFVFGAALALSSAAAAQPTPAADPAPVQATLASNVVRCQVDVWPSASPQALTEGFWHVDPLRPPNFGAAATELLAPARQAEVMPRAAIATGLRASSANVVVHDAPMPRADLMQTTPHASSPCLTEVVFTRSFFEKGALTGRSIRLFATVRRWDDGKLRWAWSGVGTADVAVIPTKDGTNTHDAVAAAETAFSSAAGQLADRAGAAHPGQ